MAIFNVNINSRLVIGQARMIDDVPSENVWSVAYETIHVQTLDDWMPNA